MEVLFALPCVIAQPRAIMVKIVVPVKVVDQFSPLSLIVDVLIFSDLLPFPEVEKHISTVVKVSVILICLIKLDILAFKRVGNVAVIVIERNDTGFVIFTKKGAPSLNALEVAISNVRLLANLFEKLATVRHVVA